MLYTYTHGKKHTHMPHPFILVMGQKNFVRCGIKHACYKFHTSTTMGKTGGADNKEKGA
jgi:hypothetical protein